jgi:hypothetical protein
MAEREAGELMSLAFARTIDGVPAQEFFDRVPPLYADKATAEARPVRQIAFSVQGRVGVIQGERPVPCGRLASGSVCDDTVSVRPTSSGPW